MSALIIGGDNLGKIKEQLNKKGFTDINHISGRKSGEKKENFVGKAEKADLVIVLVNYINHGLVTNLKNKVNHSNIIFTKRSWSHIEKYINSYLGNNT